MGKKLFGGFKLGFSGSADDEDADQALPEIAQDVANLPDLELRNKAREDIDKLDQETDPADAESRIKVIISMLLLKLQKFSLEPFKIQFGWGRKSEDRPQDDDDESDKEAKKTRKSRESPVKRLFEGFKLGFSSSEEGADQSLPDIDAVAELPDTELRSRATVEIEQLDKEKDPAEAESRIKQIMSMLLLRLQRLQDREAEVETISDPKEREVARAEIEKERAELNAEFESVEAKGSKFKLPKFNLEPFKFKFGWGSGDKDEKTTEPEPQKEEKEKKAKKPKDSSKKKLFGGFKLGFSGSADDEDADQALPEIAQDVANLPNLNLKGSRLNFGSLNLLPLASTDSNSAFSSALSFSISALATSRSFGSLIVSTSASLSCSLWSLRSSMLMICLILDSASAGSFSLSSCSISTVALLLSSVSGSSATASMSGRLWSEPSSEEEKPSLKPSNSLLTGLSLDFFVFFASLSDSSSSSCGLSSLLRPHPNWILKGSRLGFGNLNLKLLAFFSTASKSAFTSALSASISALAASRLLGSVMESSSASLPSSLCNLSSSMLMITPC